MRIEDDVKLDFKDVLIKPKRSTLRSRKDVNLGRTFTFKYSGHKWKGVPIIASNMDTVGTFEMAIALTKNHMLTCVHKYYSLDDWKKKMSILDFGFVAPSIGANGEDLERFQELYKIAQDVKMSPDPIYFLCIDVANGYGEYFPEFVKQLREQFLHLTIIAGNVVTDEMTEQLILSGADIIKVGLGSGSVCTTRLQTGVGYPQLSAIIECADAAHGLGGQIISDGGCVCPGDVAKAFGAGADFVMLGSMLAGHNESGGEVEDGKRTFYGMSSETANKKYSGGLKNYRAAEGKEVLVEDKGAVDETIQQILGGVRSTCTYIGAPSLKQLSKCTTFVRVTQQANEVYST